MELYEFCCLWCEVEGKNLKLPLRAHGSGPSTTGDRDNPDTRLSSCRLLPHLRGITWTSQPSAKEISRRAESTITSLVHAFSIWYPSCSGINTITQGVSLPDQNFDQLFWSSTIDHADFWGFDHWLCWISTIDHWLKCTFMTVYRRMRNDSTSSLVYRSRFTVALEFVGVTPPCNTVMSWCSLNWHIRVLIFPKVCLPGLHFSYWRLSATSWILPMLRTANSCRLDHRHLRHTQTASKNSQLYQQQQSAWTPR